MVIHVKDEETDALVRKLARQRGIGITAAIKEAVQEALVADTPTTSLWERTADLREQLSSYSKTGEVADKKFFDEMWEGTSGDVR
jgi:antitoxin VapB